MRRHSWWGIPLAASFAFACAGEPETEDTGGEAARVDLHRVGLESVEQVYEASGTLEAQQTAVLTSRVPGYVREVRVKAGDPVREGQVLVVIEGEAIRARLGGARAAREEAEAGEAEALNRVSAAESRARLAQTTYDRIAKLAEQRAVTAQELDEATSRREAAQAGHDAAIAGLRRVRAGLERASAEVASAEAYWADTSVRAPYPGRVIERHVDVGNLAGPGTPLLVVEQEGPLVARVSVDEAYSGRVRVGDPVEVELERAGEPERVPGVVREVSPSVDPGSRAFEVRIDLNVETDNASDTPGRFVRVRLPMGAVERLRVPETSLMRRGQLEFVYVVSDGRARLRLVTLGAASDGWAEVLSGLGVGDIVVESAKDVPAEGARLVASP